MRSKPIPMIYQGRIMQGIRLAACWQYSADPSSALATLKFYGINNSGETLLGTVSLSYGAADEWSADYFKSLTRGDYPYLVYELDTSTDTNGYFVTLNNVELLGFVETVSDEGTAITH